MKSASTVSSHSRGFGEVFFVDPSNQAKLDAVHVHDRGFANDLHRFGVHLFEKFDQVHVDLVER